MNKFSNSNRKSFFFLYQKYPLTSFLLTHDQKCFKFKTPLSLKRYIYKRLKLDDTTIKLGYMGPQNKNLKILPDNKVEYTRRKTNLYATSAALCTAKQPKAASATKFEAYSSEFAQLSSH